MEAMVGGQGVKALIDPYTINNFLEEKEVRTLGVPYKEEQGWLKDVN